LQWLEGPGLKAVDRYEQRQRRPQLLVERQASADAIATLLPNGVAQHLTMLRSQISAFLQASTHANKMELLELELQYASKAIDSEIPAPLPIPEQFNGRAGFIEFLLAAIANLDPRNNGFTSAIEDARLKLAKHGRTRMKGHEWDALQKKSK